MPQSPLEVRLAADAQLHRLASLGVPLEEVGSQLLSDVGKYRRHELDDVAVGIDDGMVQALHATQSATIIAMKLTVSHVDELPADGTFAPEGQPLSLQLATLAAGDEIVWEADDHGDEGVYVLDGALEVDGHVAPAGGAVVVEAGVAATARAVDPTELVRYRQVAPERTAGGEHVHVVGPGGWFESGGREGVTATWFADSTCATCDIQLFRVTAPGDRDGPPHHHSADEIIYTISGTTKLGPREYPTGTLIAIPGDVRYKFLAGAQRPHVPQLSGPLLRADERPRRAAATGGGPRAWWGRGGRLPVAAALRRTRERAFGPSLGSLRLPFRLRIGRVLHRCGAGPDL